MSAPALIDSRTVRLPSGQAVSVGPGLTEFRIEGDGFVTRFHRFGKDREYGWLADASAESPDTAAWGSAWSVTTEPGVHVGVDPSRTVLTFPNGVAQLPGRLGMAVQAGDRFIVIVQSFPGDSRNVYAYDDDGRQLWRIGSLPQPLVAKAYAAIDVADDGTITAMNGRPFTATLDRDTGAIVRVREGAW